MFYFCISFTFLIISSIFTWFIKSSLIFRCTIFYCSLTKDGIHSPRNFIIIFIIILHNKFLLIHPRHLDILLIIHIKRLPLNPCKFIIIGSTSISLRKCRQSAFFDLRLEIVFVTFAVVEYFVEFSWWIWWMVFGLFGLDGLLVGLRGSGGDFCFCWFC